MPTILQNHYVLAVHNVRESARFYVDVLGFKITAEPDGWIFVTKDNCMIMLGECPNDMHPSQLACHNYFAYLRVDDVDVHGANGVPGAGGTDVFTFKAIGKGKTTIHLEYVRPWEKDKAAAKTADFDLTVN